MGRFINHLLQSLRYRRVVAQRWSKNRETNDIIGLIQIARDEGDWDEAVWRCFLATHFGRPSAHQSSESQIQSASRVLCAFGNEPFWTWRRISENSESFRIWLFDHEGDLQTLAYGNHRKYESKQAKDIWEVVESFLLLAQQHQSPKELVTIDPITPDDSEEVFDRLYRRLSPLWRFGRTGRFDFLVLLSDLKLVSVEPKSCYLRSATGPKQGALRLWGNQPIKELDRLPTELARRLDLSPIVLEDALCNWQK